MKVYLKSTQNLGDFVNVFPVLSGLTAKYGKIHLIVRHEMKKFKEFKEFLMYQGFFYDISFDDAADMSPPIAILSSWTRETKNDPYRPVETCRYENWLKDNYKLDFEVDDNFVIKYPKYDIELDDTKSYCGDRWNGPWIDNRRSVHTLSGLNNVNFLNYEDSLLVNCYKIAESKLPFITSFTGIGMIADLLNKETIVLWSPEFWNPEYRTKDNNISWDNGKDINKVFEKHFYLNRKAKLVHINDLKY